ncbi:hypothetical protein TNCV_1975061 [Trichonephila clavipes]|nr:hypothetical protein TNCV_1975061 [Trichonephila clavipes]
MSFDPNDFTVLAPTTISKVMRPSQPLLNKKQRKKNVTKKRHRDSQSRRMTYSIGTIHLQTSMSSPGFEPNGTAVSVTNHYTRWAAYRFVMAIVDEPRDSEPLSGD